MPEVQQPWLVSLLPPSPTLGRAALRVSTFLLVAFVITTPFAEVMLPQLNIYIPLVATAAVRLRDEAGLCVPRREEREHKRVAAARSAALGDTTLEREWRERSAMQLEDGSLRVTIVGC